MRRTKQRGGLLRLLAEGAAVGLAGTQALDLLSIWLYRREDPRARAAENDARGGLHAYERSIDNLGRRLHHPLTQHQVGVWGWRLHKTFGVAMGVGYLALRRRAPAIGFGCGLAAGTVAFLVADELLMPLLGWTPGPRAFSWKVHARGAVAHVAYGVAAETTARALDRLADALPR